MPTAYRRFSGVFEGPYNWVASSGVQGAQEITVPLGKAEGKKPRRFTVRLIFAEPDDIAVGERMFHVQMQGERVLRDFDVVRAAGGPRRSVTREFNGVEVSENLVVQIAPSNFNTLPPVLSGLEIVEEGGR